MAIHRRVAESLEDLYGHDLAARALSLGTHYRNGEAWEKAAVFLQLAGRQAATRSAHHEAVACFDEALGRCGASRRAVTSTIGVSISGSSCGRACTHWAASPI